MKRETLEELGLTKEQMDVVFAEHGKTINDLKSRLEVSETERKELQQSFDTQQQDLEKQFSEQNKEFAIQHTMKDIDSYDTGLLMSLLDNDKIQVVNGELKGLNEQLETLRTEKAFLFKPEEKPAFPRAVAGGNPTGQLLGEAQDVFSSITDKYQN